MRALLKTAPLICYRNLCFLLPYNQEGALQPLARFGMLIMAWWLLSIVLRYTRLTSKFNNKLKLRSHKNFYGIFSSIFATKTSVFKYISLPQNRVILSAPNNVTASWSHLPGSHKSGASSSASNHQSNHNCFAWAFLFCLFSWNPNFPVWRVLPQMCTLITRVCGCD